MFVIFYKLFLNETDYFSKCLAYFTMMSASSGHGRVTEFK